MLEHGGRLREAARRFKRPVEQWLDLSTGISPFAWPVPALPQSIWQRLPETDDNLSGVACDYYGAPAALPVAGSQAAIQALPLLRANSRVGVLEPTYAEHAEAWRRAGHAVRSVTQAELPQLLGELDVLVVVNPNNPTGRRLDAEQLLGWHAELAARAGWLVVDEAFMDVTPEHSLAGFTDREGLIVLRSLGKFFGLAGLRLGFVLAAPALLGQLEKALGPWAVSGPARAVGLAALRDASTQQLWRYRLQNASERLDALLTRAGLSGGAGCALFQWRESECAERIYLNLARQGVLVRLFPALNGLRFGLPHHQRDWERLEQALNTCMRKPT